jgi:prevent-host-death family protein
MTRVPISELKAHLSAHLRAAAGGEPVIVLDRDRPIARIVPFAPRSVAQVRPPVDRGAPFGDLRPPRRKGRTDSFAALLDDRSKR